MRMLMDFGFGWLKRMNTEISKYVLTIPADCTHGLRTELYMWLCWILKKSSSCKSIQSPVRRNHPSRWSRLQDVALSASPLLFNKVLCMWMSAVSLEGWRRSIPADVEVQEKRRAFFKGTVLYIGLCLCCVYVGRTWAHAYMEKAKKPVKQSRFPPPVSAHKASPWQLRQKSLDMKTQHLFFFFLIFFLWSDSLLFKIPTIIISHDNNLYSINYLYCTIISPATKGGEPLFRLLFQSKAFDSQFLLRPQFSGASAEHKEADRQQDSFFFFFFLPVQELKQDIQQKTKTKQKPMHNC